MGFYSGPVIVTDSLIFNFDAGNDKCTDADDNVTSMRDIGSVDHSSRTDRAMHGDGITNANVSNPDDWHQIVFTATTDRNISFYVDGALLGGPIISNDTQLQINRLMAGYSSGTARYGFQGSMLCARIYAKTLSAAEVLQNFNATRRRVGI
jgi:hypothetical protein